MDSRKSISYFDKKSEKDVRPPVSSHKDRDRTYSPAESKTRHNSSPSQRPILPVENKETQKSSPPPSRIKEGTPTVSKTAHFKEEKDDSIVDMSQINFSHGPLGPRDFARSTAPQKNSWQLLDSAMQHTKVYDELTQRIALKKTLKAQLDQKFRDLDDWRRAKDATLDKNNQDLDAASDKLNEIYRRELSSRELEEFNRKPQDRKLQDVAFRRASWNTKDRIKELHKEKSRLINEKKAFLARKSVIWDEINRLKRSLDQADNYQDLQQSFNGFGNISLQDRTQYFHETPESNACAGELLGAMCRDRRIHDKMISEHSARVDGNKDRKERINPRNISFVLGKLNGNPVCIVALSRSPNSRDEGFMEDLDRFVYYYNEDKKPRVPFVVVKYSSQKYHDLIEKNVKGMGGNYTDRTCGEYDYGALVAKWKYGNDFVIDGVSNCDLYPYRKDGVYGEKAQKGTDAYKVEAPHLDNLIPDNDFVFHTKPCCPACQENRPTYFATLAGLEEYKQQNQNNPNVLPPVSPVHELDDRKSSMTQFFNMFEEQQRRNVGSVERRKVVVPPPSRRTQPPTQSMEDVRTERESAQNRRQDVDMSYKKRERAVNSQFDPVNNGNDPKKIKVKLG